MFVNALKLWSWEGRICRRQYFLALVVVVIATVMLMVATNGDEGVAQALFFLSQLALFPSQIKRLHDIGWSGWAVLLAVIPGINVLLGLGLFIFSGTKGSNAYGEDPHK